MTRHVFLWPLIIAAAALAFGCNSARRGGRTGPVDSGTPSDGPVGTDSTIMLMDSGPRDSGGGGFDSGPPRDSGGTCAPEIIDPVVGAYCSSATSDCLAACTAPCEPFADCIDLDPNPDCGACVNINLISCVNSMGCQSLWNPLSCCLTDFCPKGSAPSCADISCGPELMAWQECGGSASCGSAVSNCF